jgi:hypothetical protein
MLASLGVGKKERPLENERPDELFLNSEVHN